MTLISRYMSLIKFEHTIFALPFALISLLVASEGRPAGDRNSTSLNNSHSD